MEGDLEASSVRRPNLLPSCCFFEWMHSVIFNVDSEPLCEASGDTSVTAEHECNMESGILSKTQLVVLTVAV
eukprot:1157126-Pelagomonas_calceolata.AAC.12